MFSNLFKKAQQIEPNFYEKGDSFIGVFPLVESSGKVVVPKYPERLYQIDGQAVKEFRLLVMSEATDRVIADYAYRDGLKRLASKVIKETDEAVTLSALTTEDLTRLFA